MYFINFGAKLSTRDLREDSEDGKAAEEKRPDSGLTFT